MFQGYNRVIQLGNLTTDPELRRFAGGKTLLRFPLAVTEQVNTAGGVQDKTLRLRAC